MFKKIILTAILTPSLAMAGISEDIETKLQAEFKPIAKDIIGSQSHKTTIPAEPLGLIGFDVGVSFNSVTLNSTLKDQTYGGLSALDAVGIHANKGLPFGIDVGLNYGRSAAMTTLTGTLGYALLSGGMTYPAVTVKGTYTTTTDSDFVDFTSYGVDLGVSKGFAMVTPFASVGVVNGKVDTVDGAIGAGFNASYDEQVVRYAVGANINILIMDLLLAYNQVGDVKNMTAKLGFRF